MDLKTWLAFLSCLPTHLLRKQRNAMFYNTTPYLYTPFFPPGPVSKGTQARDKKLIDEEPPRKPDWLMIFMGVLFLLTLLLLWIVDIPHLLR